MIGKTYGELKLDRLGSWTVHDALDLPVGGKRQRGAFLYCGSGHATQNWVGQRSCEWVAVDEHEQLISEAKRQPFASANYISTFFENGGVPAQVTAPLRGDTTFRRESVGKTSIRSRSADRVVLNWGLRGSCNARAVTDEICRIAKPAAPVVIVHHHELRVDDWSIDDVLHPLLVDLRRRWKRSSRAFSVLQPRLLHPVTSVFGLGEFTLCELIGHVEARPECQRMLASRGWIGSGYLFRHVRKHWGRRAKRKVRCRVSVYAGSVPASLGEPAELHA